MNPVKQIFRRITAALCASIFLLAVMLGCGSQLVPAVAISTAFAAIAFLTVCGVAYLSGAPRASPQLNNCHPNYRYSAGIGRAAFRRKEHTPAEEHNHGRLCRLQSSGSRLNEQERNQSSSVFHFVITFFSGLFYYARDRDMSPTTSLIDLHHGGTATSVYRPNTFVLKHTTGPICAAA